MDAFDLAGLFAGRSLPALFDEGPVYVPGLMPREDQDRVVAALHTLASDRLLRRVDVVLVPDSLEPTRRYLQQLADASETRDVVVVGRAPDASSDVAWVERDGLLKQFRRTVVVVPYPGQVPRLGSWGELLRATREALQIEYPAVCARHQLDEGPWRSLRPLLPRLSNPLNLLLCANAALDAQLGPLPREQQRRSVLARLARKELAWRDPAEVMALLALHIGGEAKLANLVPGAHERAALLARLEAQRVWRDGELQDWALTLADSGALEAALSEDLDGLLTTLRRDGWRPWFSEVLATLGVSVPVAQGPEAGPRHDATEEDPHEIEHTEAPCSAPPAFSAESAAPTGRVGAFDPRSPHFFVPYRAKGEGVIGRADALTKVRTQLERGRPTSIGQATSFVGLGGLGKTQLAVEYAHTYRDRYPRGVYWFTADEDLDKQLIRLACEARWVNPQVEPRDQLDVAIEQVRTRSDCLIIFDNVEHIDAIARLLPVPSAKPHLLLTSRLPQPGFDVVSLDRLDDAQALEMLLSESRRELESDEDDTAAARITRQLEGLPLALELVGAYLRHYPDVRWRDYADQIEAEGVKARALGDGLGGDSFTRHPAGLRATLRLSDAVLDRTPRLRDVLDLLAWSGDATMGRSLLAAALDDDSSNLDLALGEAVSLRILKRGGSFDLGAEPRYQMHRLVRAVRRLDVPFETRREQWAEVPRRIGDWFEARRQEFRELARFEAEIDHLDAWQSHARELGQAREVCRLLWLRAYPPHHHGHHQQTRTIIQKALEEFDRTGLEDRLLRAHLLHDLGATFNFIGEPGRVLEYLQQALSIRRDALGEPHADTVLTLGQIGIAFGNLGDHRKALEYAQRALSIARLALGERHPDTAGILDIAGDCLLHLGEHRKALEFYEQALEIKRDMCGERHPSTALSLQGIGIALSRLGDDRRALEYELLALEIRRELLGDRHPQTISSRRDVAQCLFILKQKVAALRVVEEGLKHAPGDRELLRIRASIQGHPSGGKPPHSRRSRR